MPLSKQYRLEASKSFFRQRGAIFCRKISVSIFNGLLMESSKSFRILQIFNLTDSSLPIALTMCHNNLLYNVEIGKTNKTAKFAI